MKNNQITFFKRNSFLFFFLFAIAIIFLIVINFYLSLKKINDTKTTILTNFERSLPTQTAPLKIIPQVQRINNVKYLKNGNIEITNFLQNGNIKRICEYFTP